MLKGEAKAEYQRKYMKEYQRKKRSKQGLNKKALKPLQDLPVRFNCIGLEKPCPICQAKDGHPSGFCHL